MHGADIEVRQISIIRYQYKQDRIVPHTAMRFHLIGLIFEGM